MRVNRKSSKEATNSRAVGGGTAAISRCASSQTENKHSDIDDSGIADEKIAIDDWAENFNTGPVIPVYSESDDFEFLPISLSSILPFSESIDYLSYPEPSSNAAEIILEADNKDKVVSESWFNIKEITGTDFDTDLCTTKLNWFDLIDSSFFGLPCVEIADIGIDLPTTPEDLGIWLSNKETYHADHIMATDDAIITEMDIIGLPDLENWFDIVERRFDEELASFQMGTVH